MSDERFVEIERDDTVWRFERSFLESNWTCLYGRGCLGILSEPTPELKQGCCSLGAHFGDGPAGEDEAMTVGAYASLLTPAQWQYHHVGPSGIYADEARTHTRVVDGACVFLNRPGFAGGAGCALHVAALEADESPTEWKPSVCWQLPIRVDWVELDTRRESATVRRWERADWGDHAEHMAWCCTERSEGGEAFVGDVPVVESMQDELRALAGDEVYVELRRRLADQE